MGWVSHGRNLSPRWVLAACAMGVAWGGLCERSFGENPDPQEDESVFQAVATERPARLVVRLKPGAEVCVVAGVAELVSPIDAHGSRTRAWIPGYPAQCARPIFDMDSIGDPELAREIGLDRYFVIETSEPVLRSSPAFGGASDLDQMVEFIAYDLNLPARWSEIGGGSQETAVDDPLFGDQWALQNTGQNGGIPGADLGAYYAWMLAPEASDESITVAVLDAGVTASHPDLAANVEPGRNFSDGGPDDWEHGFNDHGTRVAGVVSAVQQNSMGIAGVTRGAKVMSVRVLNDFNLAFPTDAAPGVVWAADNGANILNMSFGWDENVLGGVDVLHDAVRYAHDSGCLLVGSSGNSSSVSVRFPAAFPEVMAVGATDNRDKLWPNSTRGPEMSVVAPGVDVLMLHWDVFDPANLYLQDSGTSFAAPHVAGAAALLWAQYPDMTNEELRALLESTAKDLGPEGFDESYGHGRVDLLAALLAVDPGGDYEQPTCFGDYDGDGDVDLNDLLIFLVRFADGVLNADVAPPYGVLDFYDVIEYLAVFDEDCASSNLPL